jgi:hypothetical protein
MTEPTINTNITPILPPEPKPSSPLLTIILVVLVVFSLAGMGFFYWQNQQMALQLALLTTKQNSQPLAVKPTEIPTNTVEPISVSTWKTYSSTLHKFTISFPEGWHVTDTKSNFIITNEAEGIYSINMSYPDSISPEICIFPDQPDYSKELNNPLARKCGEAYITISTSPKEMRRFVKPVKSSADVEWGVYSKEATSPGWFSTVPPIIYSAPPTNYDMSVIGEMDQILATLKFTK